MRTVRGFSSIKTGWLLSFLLVISACKKDTNTGDLVDFTIDVTDPQYAVLQTIGGNLVLNNVLIIHTVQFTYAAVSPYCTSDNCMLNYTLTTNTLSCPCDGSEFGLNGFVLLSPAVFPLPVYKADLSGTLLHIHGP